MFTGIITDIGQVRSVEERGDTRARIKTAFDPASIDIGASIACNGCCLTVVDRGAGADGAWFDVDYSAETRSKTNLGTWSEGSRVNLERSLKIGDELGGHLVSGHVDGTAEIINSQASGDSTVLTFDAPRDLARFVAPKGSVALNGTSLTVNDVEDTQFSINLIPHTQSVTTWGEAQVGDKVNLEIDTLARYVARLSQFPAR